MRLYGCVQVLLVIASFCIVWGEITIPVNTPDMSPFSLLIRSVDKSDEFLVQLFTILPLVSAVSIDRSA